MQRKKNVERFHEFFGQRHLQVKLYICIIHLLRAWNTISVGEMFVVVCFQPFIFLGVINQKECFTVLHQC